MELYLLVGDVINVLMGFMGVSAFGGFWRVRFFVFEMCAIEDVLSSTGLSLVVKFFLLHSFLRLLFGVRAIEYIRLAHT